MDSKETVQKSPVFGLNEAMERGKMYLKDLEKKRKQKLSSLDDSSSSPSTKEPTEHRKHKSAFNNSSPSRKEPTEHRKRKQKLSSLDDSSSSPSTKEPTEHRKHKSAFNNSSPSRKEPTEHRKHKSAFNNSSPSRKEPTEHRKHKSAFNNQSHSGKNHVKVYITKRITKITKQITCDHYNDMIRREEKRRKHKTKSFKGQTLNEEEDAINRKSKKKKKKHKNKDENNGKKVENERYVNKNNISNIANEVCLTTGIYPLKGKYKKNVIQEHKSQDNSMKRTFCVCKSEIVGSENEKIEFAGNKNEKSIEDENDPLKIGVNLPELPKKKKKRSTSLKEETDVLEQPKKGIKYKETEYVTCSEMLFHTHKEKANISSSVHDKGHEIKKKKKQKLNTVHDSEMLPVNIWPLENHSDDETRVKTRKEKEDYIQNSENLSRSNDMNEIASGCEKYVKKKKKFKSFNIMDTTENVSDVLRGEEKNSGLNHDYIPVLKPLTVTLKSPSNKSQGRSNFGISPLSRLLNNSNSLCNTCWEYNSSCSKIVCSTIVNMQRRSNISDRENCSDVYYIKKPHLSELIPKIEVKEENSMESELVPKIEIKVENGMESELVQKIEMKEENGMESELVQKIEIKEENGMESEIICDDETQSDRVSVPIQISNKKLRTEEEMHTAKVSYSESTSNSNTNIKLKQEETEGKLHAENLLGFCERGKVSEIELSDSIEIISETNCNIQVKQERMNIRDDICPCIDDEIICKENLPEISKAEEGADLNFSINFKQEHANFGENNYEILNSRTNSMNSVSDIKQEVSDCISEMYAVEYSPSVDVFKEESKNIEECISQGYTDLKENFCILKCEDVENSTSGGIISTFSSFKDKLQENHPDIVGENNENLSIQEKSSGPGCVSKDLLNFKKISFSVEGTPEISSLQEKTPGSGNYVGTDEKSADICNVYSGNKVFMNNQKNTGNSYMELHSNFNIDEEQSGFSRTSPAFRSLQQSTALYEFTSGFSRTSPAFRSTQQSLIKPITHNKRKNGQINPIKTTTRKKWVNGCFTESDKYRIYLENCKPPFKTKYHVSHLLDVHHNNVIIIDNKGTTSRRKRRQDVYVRFPNEESQERASARAPLIKCKTWRLLSEDPS